MKKPTVVAFLGRAGSGKSTASNLLVEKGARRISFAGPLKDLAKEIMGFSHEQLYGSQEVKETIDPRYGMSPRKFLQLLGNGSREIIGQNVWVDACFNTIKKEFEKGCDFFVIDDCRYVSEAKHLMNSPEVNGFVIKLECVDAVSSADPNHPSEAQVDMVPEELISRKIISKISQNSEDLLEKVEQAVEELGVISFCERKA